VCVLTTAIVPPTRTAAQRTRALGERQQRALGLFVGQRVQRLERDRELGELDVGRLERQPSGPALGAASKRSSAWRSITFRMPTASRRSMVASSAAEKRMSGRLPPWMARRRQVRCGAVGRSVAGMAL
jgi:hypothetical protein